MFTMHNVVSIVAYLFDGRAPSRHAVICCMVHRSTSYGYPACHRAIRHGYLAYGDDGRSLVLTDVGRDFIGH